MSAAINNVQYDYCEQTRRLVAKMHTQGDAVKLVHQLLEMSE